MLLGSSSSSASSAPISEHSRLHKLTPLWTILPTHPRCVETKVMGPKVELYSTEPCLPWSTCPASPICWRTIDGCSKNAWVVLWWVGSRKMSEQTKSSLCDNWGDWGLTCSTPHFFVGDMRRIWNMNYTAKTPLVKCIEMSTGGHSHTPRVSSLRKEVLGIIHIVKSIDGCSKNARVIELAAEYSVTLLVAGALASESQRKRKWWTSPFRSPRGCRKDETQCVFLLVGVRKGIRPVKLSAKTPHLTA